MTCLKIITANIWGGTGSGGGGDFLQLVKFSKITYFKRDILGTVSFRSGERKIPTVGLDGLTSGEFTFDNAIIAGSILTVLGDFLQGRVKTNSVPSVGQDVKLHPCMVDTMSPAFHTTLTTGEMCQSSKFPDVANSPLGVGTHS